MVNENEDVRLCPLRRGLEYRNKTKSGSTTRHSPKPSSSEVCRQPSQLIRSRLLGTKTSSPVAAPVSMRPNASLRLALNHRVIATDATTGEVALKPKVAKTP